MLDSNGNIVINPILGGNYLNNVFNNDSIAFAFVYKGGSSR